MKVWLVGCEGQLGTACRRSLSSRSHTFTGTSHSRVDITDLSSVRAFAASEPFTHILNCAAYTDVDRAEEEESLALEANGGGAEHLGIVAREIGARLLHFSTDYVFGGGATLPYTEASPCSPLNAYGRTKLEGEQRLQRTYPEACIVRASWLFGREGSNFVKTMLRLFQEREQVSVVADQRGRPTYAEDLAEAALSLFNHSGIYHFANSGVTTWHAFAETIRSEAHALGLPIVCSRITPVPSSAYVTAARRPAYSVLSTDKIEKALGFEPRPWVDALRELLVDLT